jgi:hypothetical protein
MIPQERIVEVAHAFEAHLSRELKGQVVTKELDLVHQGIAKLFDVADDAEDRVRNLATYIHMDVPELGLPTGTEYLSRFGTTIGERVALPKAWRADDYAENRFDILTHEFCHVTQYHRGVDAGWWPKVVSHSVLYLTAALKDDASEYLGHVEGDAAGAGAAIDKWMGRPLRAIPGLVQTFRRSYAIRPAGAVVAEQTLRTHYRALEVGGQPNVKAARVALEWLRANAPEFAGAFA